MLSIENLSFSYGKHAPVLKGINLSLEAGEVGILLGKNGSGKTTLFKNLLGILSPKGGAIRFDGKDLTKLPRGERAKLIAYVPQDIRFGALTVFDTVLMGRVAHFGLKASKADYEAAEKALRDMGLEAFALRNAEQLSGGEKQKLAIARAMAQEPRLLVFDEPTGNLDIANEKLIIEEAKKLAREKNIAVLSSIHDLNRALGFGDRFFFLKNGVIAHQGGREAFDEAAVKNAFGTDVKIVEIEGRKIIIER